MLPATKNAGEIMAYVPKDTTKTPPEVLAAISEGLIIRGVTKRLRHLYRRDGTACSIDRLKDACLDVVWEGDTVKYFCHRCGWGGYVPMNDPAPSTTIALIKHLQEEMILERNKSKKISDIIEEARLEREEAKRDSENRKKEVNLYLEFWKSLPDDFKFLSAAVVPEGARYYLNKYGINAYQYGKYDVGFSATLDRIIFPCYHYIRGPHGSIITKRLMGWIGRCYKDISKTERVKQKRPKWIARKIDPSVEKLFFWAPRAFGWTPKSPVVWVEDAVSAMRVCQTTGNDVVAVLNTSLPYHLISNYRDSYNVVWLDGNMHQKITKYVKRYNTLGFKIAGVYQDRDPKDYTEESIRTFINNAIIETAKQI